MFNKQLRRQSAVAVAGLLHEVIHGEKKRDAQDQDAGICNYQLF